MKKRVRKRLSAFVLAAVLAVTGVMPATAAGTVETSNLKFPVVQGAVTSIITGNWSALALEYIERGVFKGINAVIDTTEGTEFSEVLNKTKRLLNNPTSNAVSDLQETCDQILEELEVIDVQLLSIEAQIADLEKHLTQTDVQEKHDVLVDFYTKYLGIYNIYADLADALNTYAAIESPTDADVQELQEAYDKVAALYSADFSGKITVDAVSYDFNFTTDLNTFLQAISPYLATQKITSGTEPYDTAGWGAKGTSLTYMDYVFTQLQQTVPVESAMYEAMNTAYNEVASYAMVYLNAYRMYTEFGAQMINSSASTTRTNFQLAGEDIYLESEKQTELKNLWETYNENVYRMQRGLEQMLSLHEGVMDQLMRPYDVDFMIGMDYKAERSVVLLDSENDSDGVGNVYAANSTETGEWLKAYQLKTYGNSRALCILQTKENTLTLRDLTGETAGNALNGYITIDADWINLQNSDSPYHYEMIKDVTHLSPIYNAGGFTDTYNVYEFLKSQTYLDGTSIFPNIPTVDTSISEEKEGYMIPMYYLKTQRCLCSEVFSDGGWGTPDCVVYGLNNDIIGRQNDQDLDFINISNDLNPHEPSDSVVELDLEDDIRDDGDASKEAFVVLTGETADIMPSVYTEAVSGGTIVSESKADGTEYTGRAVLGASTPMVLKIKPEEGKTIDYVSMHLKNSGKRVDLLSGNGTATSASEIPKADRETVNDLYVDADGYYIINYSVPYQDAWLEVGFRDVAAEETPSAVTLEQEANMVLDLEGNTIDASGYQLGEVQFESNNGLTTSNVFKGEQVNVLVRPYTGYVVTGIVVKDEAGNVITSTEIAADGCMISPTAKAYTFTMPDKDVTVAACYQEGHTVTITQPANGTAQFYVGDCLDEDWLRYPVTFATGELVQVDVQADSGYYFSTCDVIGIKSNEMPADCAASYGREERDKNGNIYEIGTIMFTAGDTSEKEDYTVQPVCTAKVSGNYTVTLDADHNYALIYFLTPVMESDGVTPKTDADGKLMFKKVTARELHYNAGDTVYAAFETRYDDTRIVNTEVTAGSSTVTTSELDVDNININEGKTDMDDVVKVIRFNMVSGNVTVSTDSEKRVQVTLEGDRFGHYELSDTNTVWPGEKVYIYRVKDDKVQCHLSAVDAAGNEVPVVEESNGVYYIVPVEEDVVVTVFIENVYEVTYSFQNSLKYAYGLEGLYTDNGAGQGCAIAGTEMYLWVVNDRRFPALQYLETHWVLDADGNAITLTADPDISGLYSFTMPDGPIQVYGYSKHLNVIISGGATDGTGSGHVDSDVLKSPDTSDVAPVEKILFFIKKWND